MSRSSYPGHSQCRVSVLPEWGSFNHTLMKHFHLSGAIPGFRGASLNKVELDLSLQGLSLLSLETDSLGFRVGLSTTEIELLPLSERRLTPAAHYKYSSLKGCS